MSKSYNRIHTAVPMTNYQKAEFEAHLEQLGPTTISQTLTGSGAASIDYLRTLLHAAIGTYAVTLAAGSEEGEVKELFHIGTGGTFNVSGTFQDFTTLQFDTVSRSAWLVWVNSKWVMVAGNARQII